MHSFVSYCTLFMSSAGLSNLHMFWSARWLMPSRALHMPAVGPLEWLAIKAIRAPAAQPHASVIERQCAVNGSNTILSLMLHP